MLDELKKPKQQQKLTEDFFIEMERALTTVQRAMPDAFSDKDKVRNVLIRKFRDDVIDNRVHFRLLGKIARAGKVGSNIAGARRALRRVFEADNSYSIEQAFQDSVAGAYQERDILTRLEQLVEYLKEVDSKEIDAFIRRKLQELIAQAKRLLRH